MATGRGDGHTHVPWIIGDSMGISIAIFGGISMGFCAEFLWKILDENLTPQFFLEIFSLKKWDVNGILMGCSCDFLMRFHVGFHSKNVRYLVIIIVISRISWDIQWGFQGVK